METKDLPNLRRVARSGAVTYTGHALDQMLDRGIKTDDVEEILGSSTNQLIEVQSPSVTSGKCHKDERILIYDPEHDPDAIAVITLQFNPGVELLVITAEMPKTDIWDKIIGRNPTLIRK